MRKLIFCFLFCVLFIIEENCFAWSTRTYTADNFIEMVNIEVLNSTATIIHRWLEKTPVSASARYSSAMSYDIMFSSAVLFSGINAPGSAISDLWIYSPSKNNWTQRSIPSEVSPREGHCFVNISSGNFLMFGGLGAVGYLNDTYIYNMISNTWTKKNFTVEPSSRAYFSVCYTSDTKRVYIFGGTNGSEYFNDLWYYDLENSSWVYVSVVSSPSARKGHKMAYNPKLEKIVMFGGENDISGSFSDLWEFDTQTNNWQEITQTGDKPFARSDFIFEYLPEIDRFILFGGFPLNSETWLYNQNTNEWSTTGHSPSPAGRYQLTSFVCNNELYIFGGNTGTTALNDLWKYTVKSSGTFVLQISTTSPTSIVWKEFRLNNTVIPNPSSTTVKFQIASSQDGFTWDEYRGYNGSTTTFYEGSGPHNIWSGHSGKLNIRIKGYLETSIPPKSPEVSEIQISFNITPTAPQLNFPGQLSPLPENRYLTLARTNQLQPLFNWNKSIDTESDPITYRIQVAVSSSFLPVYIDQGGIVETSSPTVNFNLAELLPGTSLYEGAWHWRVYAQDTSTGPWSDVYAFYVDTTPPSNVVSITALKVGNGKIELKWTSPGDDETSGYIYWGKYYIRYSTSGQINDENGWNNAIGEKSGNFSGASGQEITSSVEGLLDGTTYWFAIKVQDTAVNISTLSSVSPCAKTNSRPQVQIIYPSSGTLSKEETISWTYSDEDTEDTHTFDIKLSSDSEVSYSINVATELPDETTTYIWNTRQVKNGYYYLKLIAKDQDFLSGETTSYIEIYNENEPPSVEVILPSSTTLIVSDKLSINWIISDPNGEDTHNIKIYYSDDDGLNFQLLDGAELTSQTTFYIWDTTKNKNGPNYRLKIYVEENNTQVPLSTYTITHKFSVDNRNRAPNSFKLVSPPSGAVLPVIKIELKWENNQDPNPEDYLTWTVHLSTNEYFTGYISIENILQNSYFLTPKDGIFEGVKYYWRVRATDPLGKSAFSSDIFSFTTLDRKKAFSVDGNLYAEVISGMPEDGFLYIEKILPENYSILNTAQRYSVGDRLIKIISEDFYKVVILDLSQNEIASDNVEANLSFKYPSNTKVPVDKLRIARLNESVGRLEFPPSKQQQNKYNNSIDVVVKGLSIFTLVGSNVPDRLLSNINIFPNPFSAGKEDVHIRYTLNEDAKISFKIFTLIGDLVKEWEYDAGIDGKSKGIPEGWTNETLWNGRNGNGNIVANGMYLLVIDAESKNSSIREMKYIGVIKRL